MSTGNPPSLSSDTEIVCWSRNRTHLLVSANSEREVWPLTDEPVPATVLRVLPASWAVLSPSLSLSELVGEEHGDEEGEEQGEQFRTRSARR